MFDTTIFTNLDECRTECEISDDISIVAIVYEKLDGWNVNSLRAINPNERKDVDACVAVAKERLSHYVNRLGHNAPENLTLAGLSLWLMEKDDGTAMGLKVRPQEDYLLFPVSSDLGQKVRLLARDGKEIEAIRQLRSATNCSLEQAKAWIADNR